MELDKRVDQLDSDRLMLTASGDDWWAICSPALDQDCDSVLSQEGAPFPIEVQGDYPNTDELQDRFGRAFDQYIDEVYETLAESDNLIDTVMGFEVQVIEVDSQ